MADMFDPQDGSPPPASGPVEQRVADTDRDRMITLLREHVVDGRLTLDEFSERVGLALEARTRGDLESLVGDLPATAVPQDEAVRRKTRRRFIAFMSGSSAKGRWRASGQTTAVAVMGGVDIDLRQAEIDGPEVVITAVAFWGGIQIIVPEGIDVQLEGFSFMGGRNLRLKNVPIVPGSPRIRVRGFSIMGGIDVRSKSSRPGVEIGQTIVDHVLGAMDSLPGLAGSTMGPIDLSALGRDIREQIRAQRHSNKQWAHDVRHGHDPFDRHRQWGGPAPAPPPPPVPAAPAPATDARGDVTGAPEGDVRRSPSEGTVTILFSDMVDYAGMTERLGDPMSRELLREHHRVVRELLESHGGREVKVQGDGFMVAFGGVARALRCAAEMQRAFTAYSERHPERPIQVHVGIHTGEAMEEDDDFLGHTVIVASRLADVAGPGEILVSSLSVQMVEHTEEFRFGEFREATLKGLTRTQKVATLAWDV